MGSDEMSVLGSLGKFLRPADCNCVYLQFAKRLLQLVNV